MEIWSKEIKRAAENVLVMAKLVKRFDSDVASAGDVVHVPNLSNLTATYKVANADVAQSATTEVTTDITINKHAVVRVDVEDMAKVQSQADLLREYTGKMGYAIGHIVDDDLMALYSGLSQTVGATVSNVGIAKSYVLGAIRLLDTANAPQDDRNWVVEAYGKKQLFNIEDFVRYDASGRAGTANPIVRGQAALGEIYGVAVNYSENTYSSGSMIYSMMFHREALALAMQKDFRTQQDYEAKRLATVVVSDALYGVAKYRDTFGVVISYGNAA